MSTTTPELQATIVTLDEATEFAGNVTTLRAEQTGGGYSLMDFTLAADGHGPAPHKHETFDEIYHVIEGTLTVTIESEQRAAPAGSSIFVPRGVVHTFVNNGDVPARFLFVMSPGGFERCFDDLAAVMARDGEITPGAFAEVISGYDVTIAV
jgi:mannose-6-phosphate isomerase-like protein (cupin superfamily)